MKKTYSTREAARLLGVHLNTLQRYISTGKIQAPPVQRAGKVQFRIWTLANVERVRKQLSGIKDGRKKRRT